jgi:hypothetical protein
MFGDPDIFEVETGIEKLSLIGSSKIDAGLTFRAKVGRDFRTDFKAAKADTRANGSVNTGELRTQCKHLADSDCSDLFDSASPASVDSSNNSGCGVGEKNRKTISGTDREPKLGRSGDEGIGFTLEAGSFAAKNFAGMNLLDPGVRVFIEPGIIFASAESVFDIGQFFECRCVDHPS